MTSGMPLSNASPLATEVNELLDSLHGYLNAAMNPDRLALRHLGVDQMGCTRTAYNDEAFKVWSKELRKKPDDCHTIHHLAIMHHARAMDLEHGPNPKESDDDWEAAMEYWLQLHKDEAFWDYIAGIACKKTKRDAVDELRERLPELLLQVHYDIAFALETKKYRAKYHINMAQEASFSDASKEAVRREAYSRFIRSVPNSVWQSDMLDPETIKQGSDVIEKYLELDPGCTLALEDSLRLQVRLLRARHQDLQASGSDSSERNKLLNLLKKDADYWRQYFDQLVPGAEELDDDIRHKLCLWYRVMGQVYRALDKHEHAISLYEQGVAASAEEDERQRCVLELGETLGYVARERVLEGTSGAKEYCDRVRARTDLSVTAHFLLANAYRLLDEFDTAEEMCRAGMSIEPEIMHFDAMQEHERDRKRLTEMLESIAEARRTHEALQLLGKATKALEVQSHETAREFLDQAIQLDSSLKMAYFLRCQCHLFLIYSDEAQADFDRFRQLDDSHEDPDARQAINHLEQECKNLAHQVGQFGREALNLRRQAVRAFKKRNVEHGLALIDRAISVCGEKAWKKELAQLLNGVAVEIYEPVPALEEPFGKAAKEIMSAVSREVG